MVGTTVIWFWSSENREMQELSHLPKAIHLVCVRGETCNPGCLAQERVGPSVSLCWLHLATLLCEASSLEPAACLASYNKYSGKGSERDISGSGVEFQLQHPFRMHRPRTLSTPVTMNTLLGCHNDHTQVSIKELCRPPTSKQILVSVSRQGGRRSWLKD